MKFNAEQLLKYCILEINAGWEDKHLPTDLSPEQVDDMFEEAGCLRDAIEELREGEYETDIPSENSRHYESSSVASVAPNGEWVGWTFWYGGGKHGEPEEVEWFSKAYLLCVKEEEKMVTVRTFNKIVQQ